MKYNGGIDSYSIKINGRDITKSVQNFDIFLDIFLIGWTCNINIADGNNMLTTFPIKQFDTVEVYVKTDVNKPCSNAKSKTIKFKIIKINNQRMLNSHLQEYQLVCVSSLIVDDLHNVISKQFNNTTSFQAIKYIISNSFSNYDLTGLEDSASKNFSVNSLTPISAIQWITKFSTYNNSPDCVTFLSDIDKITIDSFERMFTYGASFKMIHRPQNMLDAGGNYNESDYLAILSYELRQFDAIKEIVSGHHSSTNFKIDPFNRTFSKTQFNMGDDNENDKDSQSWENPTNFKSTNVVYSPTTGEDIYSSQSYGRMSALMKLNKHVTTITAYGSVCWLNMLGKVVDLSAPPLEDITNASKDKFLSGPSVVTAVRFHVRPNYSRVYVDLVKKRLAEKPKSLGVL